MKKIIPKINLEFIKPNILPRYIHTRYGNKRSKGLKKLKRITTDPTQIVQNLKECPLKAGKINPKIKGIPKPRSKPNWNNCFLEIIRLSMVSLIQTLVAIFHLFALRIGFLLKEFDFLIREHPSQFS